MEEEKFVGIICSASNNATSHHKSIARSVASYLASDGYNLIYGGYYESLMGACYEEFLKNNRKIYAMTTDKYKNAFDMIDADRKILCETTFDLKKRMFENSDIIVVLPGGVGTYSELLSFIEEKRSNEKDTPIEIYDEDDYFLPFIELLKIMEINGLVDDSVYETFKVSHNKEEFVNHILDYKRKRKGVK